MLCALLSFGNMDVQVVGQKLVSFKLMEGLFLLMCAMQSPIKSSMMWFLFLCLFTTLHNKLTWLWRFYISISRWLTTLRNYLWEFIFIFFNMGRELLSLKDLLLYSMWRHWISFVMWRHVGCQFFLLLRGCW
jgi:hypothetical protein